MSAFERIIIFYIIYYLVLAPSLWGTVWEAGVSAKEFVPPHFQFASGATALLVRFASDLLWICCIQQLCNKFTTSRTSRVWAKWLTVTVTETNSPMRSASPCSADKSLSFWKTKTSISNAQLSQSKIREAEDWLTIIWCQKLHNDCVMRCIYCLQMYMSDARTGHMTWLL